MLGGCGTEPITYLEVCDEAPCHRKSRTYHSADDGSSHHSRSPFETDGNHYHRRQYERHQRHTRHGISTHDGYGICRHGSKQKSYHCHYEYTHYCVPNIEIDDADKEKDECYQQSYPHTDGDNLHREVSLRAFYRHRRRFAFAFHLGGSQPYGTAYYAPRPYDTDDTCHSNAADTDVSGKGREYLFGSHTVDATLKYGIDYVQSRIAEQRHNGHHHKPYQSRACTYYGGIPQTDDITESQYGGSDIDAKHQFGFRIKRFAERQYLGGKRLCPRSEGSYEEIVQTSRKSGNDERAGLVATLLARNKHLCGSRCLREWVFAVHIADKIFTKRYQKQYAEHSAKKR